MDKSSILKKLSETKPVEAGECFLSVIRKSVNEAILNVLSEEVSALCGVSMSKVLSEKIFVMVAKKYFTVFVAKEIR